MKIPIIKQSLKILEVFLSSAGKTEKEFFITSSGLNSIFIYSSIELINNSSLVLESIIFKFLLISLIS